MKARILTMIQESIETKQLFCAECVNDLETAARMIIDTFRAGRSVYVFGNGGSAADSQHLAGELVGRFRRERRALPCVALSTDTSVLTAWANDYAYETVFVRQVQAHVREGDLVIGISTSGNSRSVVDAVAEARRLGARTMGMTGAGGGKLAKQCDVCLKVPSKQTPRIQECHVLAIHILCELVEGALFD